MYNELDLITYISKSVLTTSWLGDCMMKKHDSLCQLELHMFTQVMIISNSALQNLCPSQIHKIQEERNPMPRRHNNSLGTLLPSARCRGCIYDIHNELERGSLMKLERLRDFADKGREYIQVIIPQSQNLQKKGPLRWVKCCGKERHIKSCDHYDYLILFKLFHSWHPCIFF